MSTGPDMRGTGRTTEQMRNARVGAFFVWVNDRLEYPRELAINIRRTDIRIISRGQLDRVDRFSGQRAHEIILDHALRISDLSDRQYAGLMELRHILRCDIDRP